MQSVLCSKRILDQETKAQLNDQKFILPHSSSFPILFQVPDSNRVMAKQEVLRDSNIADSCRWTQNFENDTSKIFIYEDDEKDEKENRDNTIQLIRPVPIRPRRNSYTDPDNEAMPKGYTCSECGEDFIKRKIYIEHLQNHGQKIRKYKCDVCGWAFQRNSNLKVHYRSHTGERPFHCDKCGVEFSRKGSLIRHCDRFHSRRDSNI